MNLDLMLKVVALDGGSFYAAGVCNSADVQVEKGGAGGTGALNSANATAQPSHHQLTAANPQPGGAGLAFV